MDGRMEGWMEKKMDGWIEGLACTRGAPSGGRPMRSQHSLREVISLSRYRPPDAPPRRGSEPWLPLAEARTPLAEGNRLKFGEQVVLSSTLSCVQSA